MIKNYAFVHVDVEDNGDAIIRELSGTDLKGELKSCYDLNIFDKTGCLYYSRERGFRKTLVFSY